MKATQDTNDIGLESNAQLADLLEEAARRLRAAAAREDASTAQIDLTKGKAAMPAPATSARDQRGGLPAPSGAARTAWEQTGTIPAFEHKFPEGLETFIDMKIWECHDERGRVVFAVGCPRERMAVYGRERGWLSIWQVVNGTPRDLRSVHIETDDHEETGDRAALIYGKDGRSKGLYDPTDHALLPSIYSSARVELHRDRCHGPYAKNRLALIANEQDEIEIMLDHALHNHRLRG